MRVLLLSLASRKYKVIGFFCIREAADYLYLHTLQLISSCRGQGYGTALLRCIEEIARSKKLTRIRLSVFKEIPARRLYCKLGYVPIEQDEYRIWMEKLV